MKRVRGGEVIEREDKRKGEEQERGKKQTERYNEISNYGTPASLKISLPPS